MNNSRNDNFNSDYVQDVDRRIMERDSLFNYASKQKPFNMPSSSHINVGEITGLSSDVDHTVRGMPLRNFVSDSYKSQTEELNKQLDFELYSSKTNIDISYYDPYLTTNNTDYSTLEEVSNTNLINNKSNPAIVFSSICNDFSLDLLNRFINSLPSNNSILLFPNEILTSLVTLYRGSSGETDKCFNSILSLDKTTIFDACNKTHFLIKGIVNNSVNCILIPHPLPINVAFQSFTKHTTCIHNYNGSENNVIDKINKFIINKTNSKNIISSVVDKSIIHQNSGIVLISTSFLKIKFKQSFSKIIKAPFGHNNISYFVAYGQHFLYTEDANHKILELPLTNENFSMGIILPKQHLIPFDNTVLVKYVSTLKPTFFELVMIPKFVHKSKYRIENIINDIGFYNLFNNPQLPDIISVNAPYNLTSILHHAVFAVSANLSSQVKPTRNGEKFSVYKPFTYYIRHNASNTLITVGKYT